jgi:hypothetical protein
MELFQCFDHLKRLGGVWKPKRIGKMFFRDSIECTMLVQVPEGVFRGAVLVTRQQDISRVKADVKFYRDGKVVDGKFKHAQHPTKDTLKICEHEDEVLFDFSRIFGIDLGWKPRKPIPLTHRRLIELADCLVVEFDAMEVARKNTQATDKEIQKTANQEVALRALSR